MTSIEMILNVVYIGLLFHLFNVYQSCRTCFVFFIYIFFFNWLNLFGRYFFSYEEYVGCVFADIFHI